MQKRILGKSGIEVGPLAFGGNVFGWTIAEATSFRLLDEFTDAGLNLVDTADVYSRWKPGNQGGESETIIGNWIKSRGRRKDVVIATKSGMDMGNGNKGLSKAHILKSAEDSLRRLQTDYIDLYQAHEDDPETPLEETLEAYDLLVKQGKVRAIGASNFSAARLQQALSTSSQRKFPAYVSLQPQYNLYDREPFESELEPVCLKNGISVITYFSLARGFLTGKYRSERDLNKSPRGGGIAKYLNERGFRIISALDEVAGSRNATPAQVALAWLMTRPSVTAPIASATSLEQLRDLIGSTRLPLTSNEIEKLNQASRPN